MPPDVSLSDQLKKIPASVRPTVKAALKAVREAAPHAEEITHRSQAPRSKSAMCKLARYAVNGQDVPGVCTVPRHSTILL